MLSFISFIIKLILAGFFSGLCRYQHNNESNGKNVIITSIIGIIGASTIIFTLSIDNSFSGSLIGSGLISSLLISFIILKENNLKPGVREVFALQIGWFIGAGKIGYALVLLFLLILIVNQLTVLYEKSESKNNLEIDSN